VNAHRRIVTRTSRAGPPWGGILAVAYLALMLGIVVAVLLAGR
jgi:hypothetical protein